MTRRRRRRPDQMAPIDWALALGALLPICWLLAQTIRP